MIPFPVDSIHSTLKCKTTAELRKEAEDPGFTNRPPEEREAVRQLLAERAHAWQKFAFALASAVLVGFLGGAWASSQELSREAVVGVGSVFAILGYLSIYVQHLFGQ